MLGLFERKSERFEALVRAEPDETAFAHVDVGLIGRRVLVANTAVEAVGGDHKIRVEPGVVGDIGLEHQLDAERFAACLQDVEQALAPDAAKTMAARPDQAPFEVHGDVVPVIERVEDLLRGFGVGGLQVAERLVGEHHAPAERVVRPIALDHRDVMRRILLFHQQREVQAGGPAADTDDSHAWRCLVRAVDLDTLDLNYLDVQQDTGPATGYHDRLGSELD